MSIVVWGFWFVCLSANLCPAETSCVYKMALGVCDQVPYLYSNSGDCVFVAPMPERNDSTEHNFYATYLVSGNTLTELFPGFSRTIAQMVGTFSRTPCYYVASDAAFSRFAIIYDSILSGYTPPGSDVTVPVTTCVGLATVDRDGNLLWQNQIPNSNNINPQQCRVVLTGDGKDARPLFHSSQTGCLLFSADGASYEQLPIGNPFGTIAYVLKRNTLFYIKKSEDNTCSVWEYDLTATGEHDTGIHFNSTLADSQLTVSSDGNTMIFRLDSNTVCLVQRHNDDWCTQNISAIGNTCISLSNDGGFALLGKQAGMTLLDNITNSQVSIDGLPESTRNSKLAMNGLEMLYIADDDSGKAQLWNRSEIGNSLVFTLDKGFQFRGLPFTPDEQSMAVLKKKTKPFLWNDGHFECLGDTLKAGQGFCVCSDARQQISLSGRLDTPPLPCRGWNLLVPALYTGLASTEWMGYDEIKKIYKQVNNPIDGKAYWIFIQ